MELLERRVDIQRLSFLRSRRVSRSGTGFASESSVTHPVGLQFPACDAQVRVWWHSQPANDGDPPGASFEGIATRYNPDTDEVFIVYDDGESHWEQLVQTPWPPHWSDPPPRGCNSPRSPMHYCLAAGPRVDVSRASKRRSTGRRAWSDKLPDNVTVVELRNYSGGGLAPCNRERTIATWNIELRGPTPPMSKFGMQRMFRRVLDEENYQPRGSVTGFSKYSMGENSSKRDLPDHGSGQMLGVNRRGVNGYYENGERVDFVRFNGALMGFSKEFCDVLLTDPAYEAVCRVRDWNGRSRILPHKSRTNHRPVSGSSTGGCPRRSTRNARRAARRPASGTRARSENARENATTTARPRNAT